jgi:large subunit ribosomal protein L33
LVAPDRQKLAKVEKKRGTMRDLIGLACDSCKRRNYTTSKNKKKQTEKFVIKKFCPSCRSHTAHRETKV